MKEKFFSLPTPIGPPWDLFRFFWREDPRGSSFALVSGLQGNQPNGLYLCSRLIQFLDRVAAEQEPGYRLRGTILILPIANPNALQAGEPVWAYDNLDLNLAFPGSDRGEVTERLARRILAETRDSQFGVILHSGPRHYRDAPHLQTFDPDPPFRAMADAPGLPVARELGDGPAHRLSLLYQWKENGVAAGGISAGKPGELDLPLCHALFQSLVHLMVNAEVLENPALPSGKHKTLFFRPQDEGRIVSHHPGLFLPRGAPGRFVKQGDPVGHVEDLYEGRVLESFSAPADGYLVRLRDYPVIYENEPVALLLKERKRKFWPF